MEDQKEKIELTILMPCLNEEANIACAIESARKFLNKNQLNGEILVIDNQSTDNSVKIAKSLNVRVITETNRGYGNAVKCGIQHANGIYTILSDCDTTYNLEDLLPFLNALRNGASLVVGNRFAGGIEKGAMPFSHRYIGVPFLSWLGRKRYHVTLQDFHCGLRGFHTLQAQNLKLKSEGMEFATELIAKFSTSHLPIVEVPIALSVSKYPRRSHLHTIRDGLRHLLYIMSKS